LEDLSHSTISNIWHRWHLLPHLQFISEVMAETLRYLGPEVRAAPSEKTTQTMGAFVETALPSLLNYNFLLVFLHSGKQVLPAATNLLFF
jgi:hypothetical protein